MAFGAVLAAAGADGARMPPPSSPYRKIVNKAQRGTGPGLPAARVALAAITARGLTGYTSPRGRRWPLAAYSERAVRTATAKLAKAPFTSAITARREALLQGHLVAVATAWGKAAGHLDPGDVVTAFRGDSRATSAAPDAAVAKRWRQEAAASAAQGWIAGVYSSGGYSGLVAALEDAVRDGMAEGEADAMAAAAYQQRLGTFDTDAAFAASLAALQGDYGVTRQAQEAAQGLIAGAALDVARALAREDGSEAEAAEAVHGAVSGSDVRPWAGGLRQALWGAFGAGAIALWRRAASAVGGLFGSGVEVIYMGHRFSACVFASRTPLAVRTPRKTCLPISRIRFVVAVCRQSVTFRCRGWPRSCPSRAALPACGASPGTRPGWSAGSWGGRPAGTAPPPAADPAAQDDRPYPYPDEQAPACHCGHPFPLRDSRAL